MIFNTNISKIKIFFQMGPIMLVSKILCRLHFLKLKLFNRLPKLITITGSIGKSSLLNMTHVLLKDKYRCKKIKYNGNEFIPLDILNVNVRDGFIKKMISCIYTILFDFTKYDYLLIEVGISEKNDIDKHIELYTSYISCFTELDYVHTEALENLDGICYEKSKLVNNSKYKLIKNNDIIKKYVKDENRIIINDQKENIYCEQTINNFLLNYTYNNTEYNICIPNIKKNQFIPKSYISLICFSIEIGNILNLSKKEIESYLSNYEMPESRSSLFITSNNNIVLDGTYNSSFKSIIEIINSGKILNKNLNKKCIIILSDIREMNPIFMNYYDEINKLINNMSNIEKIILIGKIVKEYISYKNIEYYDSTNDFITSNINFENKLIIIKGSNYFRLKNIIKYL